MGPSNIELLAQSFSGWGKDNPANMRDLLHPDCEMVVPDSVPYGGTFMGPDAVIDWFTKELWRWFDEFTSTPEGFIDGATSSSFRSRSKRVPKTQDHGCPQRMAL